MRAVTLVKLPNTPKFLGCFDSNYDSWWYSNPLPGSVDEIIDSTWAYGQYHVCFAKMLDNTYSIFQSNDYGVNWIEVLNFPYTIRSIYRIDYGRLLAATSDGVYASTNSGTSWSKISSDNSVRLIREIGSDKLVAICSGLYPVKMSYNRGVTWSGCASVTGVLGMDGTIDGQNNVVFTSSHYSGGGLSGSLIEISTDGGNTFSAGYPFESSGDMHMLFYWNYPAYWNWETHKDGIWASGYIKKIICTGVSKTYPYFPIFVIQVKLHTGQLRHYYAYAKQYTGETGLPIRYNFSARFDALDSVATDLSAKEILLVGKGTYQRTVVFTGANSDGTPRVMTSSDGGYTWVDQDVTTATIYSGPDLTQISGTGGAFLEDSYISTMWTGQVCHNSGSWNSSGYIQMGISYEMDFLTRLAVSREQSYSMDIYNLVPHIKTFHQDILFQKPRTKSYVFDALFRSSELFTYSMDVLNQKANLKQYSMDVLNQKANLKQYTSDVLNMHFWTELYALDEWVQKVCLEQFDMAVTSVFHFTEQFSMDSLLQKICIKNLIMDVLQEGLNNHSYSMDIKIQDTIVGDILHNTERYHWQGAAIGIGYPRSSYPIFNSRKETKT